MIIIDNSEVRHLPPSLMQLDVVTLPDLESRTGADAVLSAWSAPATSDALAWAHVKRGNGYQLKRDIDLPASVFDGRLMQQLTRMLDWWPIPWLIHVAEVTPDVNGETMINGELSHGQAYPYNTSYVSTKRNWQRAGGGWITLHPDQDFVEWVEYELKRLARDEDKRLVSRRPTKLFPLSDGEEFLVGLPGLGPTKAHALWKSMTTPSPLAALVQLVNGDAQVVDGIGTGICANIREFMGMSESEKLEVK